jgi:hypothetical protein
MPLRAIEHIPRAAPLQCFLGAPSITLKDRQLAHKFKDEGGRMKRETMTWTIKL